MKKKIMALAAAFLGLCSTQAQAQDIALKTNLVYDALLSPSLALEARVAPKWSVDLSGSVNFWTLSHDRRWKHWLVQPEARYWLCEAMGGHFFGLHLLGGEFNVGNIHLPTFLNNRLSDLRHHRSQGWFAGAGIAYGYSWMLSHHWNIEAEIGIGWAYSRYDRYECVGCGRKIQDNKVHNYVGPTKAAINISYVF